MSRDKRTRLRLRPGIPHNMIAHSLICLPIVRRLGDWLHEHTKPLVRTRYGRRNPLPTCPVCDKPDGYLRNCPTHGAADWGSTQP
jgi:hypothetical protein